MERAKERKVRGKESTRKWAEARLWVVLCYFRKVGGWGGLLSSGREAGLTCASTSLC